MGIRDQIRKMRTSENGGPSPLKLSKNAEGEIKERVSKDTDLAFFVLTQPSPIGFNVGVGFESLTADADRSLHPGFAVPLLVSNEDYERLVGYTIDFKDGRFVTATDLTIHVSHTPNPEARKFTVNRDLVTDGSATFTRPSGEQHPHLVKMLFEIPGVKALFLIKNFCSVTQEPGADWDELQSEVGKRLQAYFAHGGAPIVPPPLEEAQYDEVERKIIEVLEDAVRPAVQRDGGDIAFAGYDEGTVQLYMLGSCSGCPSSMATLKMGVEQLLKDSVPEVKEVVAIE